jgi:chromosome segregation ATPase
MKLQTIRVEGFKRFRDPLTISDLEPGINLIAAPNGRGKSTIAEAVRVAFLERHKTQSLGETLAPWSQPGATPTVQIQFERQGKVHRLSKAFGNKKSCTLVIDGGSQLTGEEAEQHLSDMLSFRFSAKGASKAEHQGVPGLLWVQQGTSGQIVTQVDNAHEYISRALSDDLGELAASEGDRVIQRVEDELALLQTKLTGRPTGEFARASQTLAAKNQEYQALQERIRKYEEQVDRFAALQRTHAEGERTRTWEEQRAEVVQARQKLQQLHGVATQLREVQLQAEITKGEIARLQSALLALDQEDSAVAEREADVTSARARLEQEEASLAMADTALNSAREKDSGARLAAAAARDTATKASHEAALATARQRKGEIEAQLKLVEVQQGELAEKQGADARLKGFAKAGARLTPKENALAAVKAKLEAVATRLEYTLKASGVSLAGQALTGAGSRTIAEPAEIVIEGIGSIRVLPGAKDLAQLQADVERAQCDLEQLLRGMGAGTAEEARDREGDLTQAEADVLRINQVIAGLAPAGVDALRGQVNTAQGEIEQHEAALAALPQIEYGGEILAVKLAEAQEQVTQRSLRDAQQTFDTARTEVAKAQEQVRLAEGEHKSAQSKVSAPGRDDLRRGLEADLVTADAKQRTQNDEANRLSEQIEAARPDLLEADIKRLTASADALEAAHGGVKMQLDVLAGELRAQGALGLQEEAAALADEVGRLARQVADRTRRAAALRHLLQVLTDKRAEVARSIRAPLQKHINHYLEIQFPGSKIELDEGLRPQRITRAGPFGTETGQFEELSGGEREQIGVIARLAYADLLKEAGKPTLVMLDDSLVNCDLDRLAQMKRVIYDAAKRHQILIFTCHEELWRDVGVAPRTLQ